MIKELWLGLNDKQSYLEKEQEILNIIKSDPGNTEVVLYTKKERSIKQLGRYVDLHDGRVVKDLKALIGDENVKCVEHVKKYERPVYKTPNIVQITPCYQEIYGVFKDESTLEETKQKVVAFALCDDGCVYPMLFDEELGISLLSDCLHTSRYELKEECLNDILENINSAMSSMSVSVEQLSDCVSYIPPTPHQEKGRHVLQISGMVDTNCY